MSRSYYRGAAGALLVYDVASRASFASLPTFIDDARALASPNLAVLLVGNKLDLASEGATSKGEELIDTRVPSTPSSSHSKSSSFTLELGASSSLVAAPPDESRSTATMAPGGRDVTPKDASSWAKAMNIPVVMEASAYSGANVEDVFTRLARIILTKIELGDIDPDDPQSGIQYGDIGSWGVLASDGGSIRSAMTVDDGSVRGRKLRRSQARRNNRRWMPGLRGWEEVLTLEEVGRKRRAGCC